MGFIFFLDDLLLFILITVCKCPILTCIRRRKVVAISLVLCERFIISYQSLSHFAEEINR